MTGRHSPRPPVACVGGGLVGSAWAALFAAHGHEVRVQDPDPAAAAVLEKVTGWASLALGVDSAAIADRLIFTTDLESALDGVAFVQESAPESLDLKQALFVRIEQSAPPSAVIASSTSDFPISLIARHCRSRRRMLVGHPLNPPYAIPLVEVVAGPDTEAAAVDSACAFYRGAGRRPLVLQGESVGFLANRLQMALVREAIRLVLRGDATVEQVDRALADGLGPRFAAVGLFGGFVLNMADPKVEAWLDHFADFRFGEDLVDEGPWPDWSESARDRIASQWRGRIGTDGVEALRRRRDDLALAIAGLQSAEEKMAGDDSASSTAS